MTAVHDREWKPSQWPRMLFQGYPTLLAILTDFIYKIFCAPTKTEADITPAFILLSRTCLSAIAISTIWRAGAVRLANGPMLQEDSLTLSALLPFTFTPTQWLDSTIYEDKGA